MIFKTIKGVIVSNNKIIQTEGGDVLHGIKKSDNGFESFGEAYISEINPAIVKGWKRHKIMVLNFVVPIGKIKFLLFDDRKKSKTQGSYQEIILSKNNYCRITIPAMIWVAFENIGDEKAILLNIASIPHDPNEVEIKNLTEIEYK